MSDKKDDTVIRIKKKPDLFILLGTGLMVLFTPFILAEDIYQYFYENLLSNGIGEILTVIMLVLCETFFLRVFLWHCRGQERITLSTEVLKIEKIGSFLNFPNTYKLEKIKSFSIAEKKTIENMYNFYKIGGGEIQFSYVGEIIKFGQSLTRMEAEKIIDQLNEEKETTNR